MTVGSAEILQGKRFEFGRNWSQFLALLDEGRIETAEHSIQTMLAVQDLQGRKFIDIGCGSGLFSLAARRLGAEVCSFDYDPFSVRCTAELKRRYFPSDRQWTIAEESVLNETFLRTLGTFDIVYSWGVLHHTGAMWQALDNASRLVAERGTFYIAIYNDQGGASRRWLLVKRLYNRLPTWAKCCVAGSSMFPLWGRTILRDVLLFGNPLRTWLAYRTQRGMSPWHDVVDWVGGYPFEVAKPEEIFEFLSLRGFILKKLKTCGGGRGCNEFVFERGSHSSSQVPSSPL